MKCPECHADEALGQSHCGACSRPLESKVIWFHAGVEVPDNDRPVLIYCPSADNVWPGVHDGDRWKGMDGTEISFLVTHWADFPKPPAE